MGDYYVGGVARGEGWLAVAYDESGYDHAAVLESVGELWTRYEETAATIAVDVPVGL